MSSYTMELRNYIEMFSQDEHMPTRNRIEAGRQHLFDFEYPLFDESYRNIFETHFIRNFYMREIGFETEGLFKFYLENWLIINMPYYNKLFESELLEFDPLTNVNYKIDSNKQNDSKRADNKDTTGNVKSKDTMHDEGTTKQTTSRSEDFDSTMDKTKDSTSQNDVTTATTSSSTTDHTGHQDNTNSSDSTTDQTDFHRDLTSDTPDSRLAITTNDGAGVIEYASEIKEGTNKANNHTVTNGESTTDETSQDKTTGKMDSKVDNDTTTHASEKDVFTSDKEIAETVNGEHTNDGTKDSNTDSIGNEKLQSDINTVEDYVSSKAGKHGSASYPQLVKEYRAALLRIERTIFDEMSKELFMLVY